MSTRSRSARFSSVFSALTLAWLFVLTVGATPTPAQNPGAGAEVEAARRKEAEADPNAGVPAESSESFFHLMVRASGKIGLVILVMSFYLTALVVWMAFEYRRSVVMPAALIQETKTLLEQRQYTEAYNRLATHPSFLARVLSAGVRKLPSGLPAAHRAMEMTNDDATMAMDHRTTYLATVGTLGPMIGLVGTVYGMIESFRVIATAGASPQASQLAGGISTALFATLEGIALSIPAIYFHAVFRNRIARLSLETALLAESLLEQFAPGVRSPHPLATAAVSQRSIAPPATSGPAS